MLTSFEENAYVFSQKHKLFLPLTQALSTPKPGSPPPKGRHFALSSSGWQEKDRALVRLTPYLVTF